MRQSKCPFDAARRGNFLARPHSAPIVFTCKSACCGPVCLALLRIQHHGDHDDAGEEKGAFGLGRLSCLELTHSAA